MIFFGERKKVVKVLLENVMALRELVACSLVKLHWVYHFLLVGSRQTLPEVEGSSPATVINVLTGEVLAVALEGFDSVGAVHGVSGDLGTEEGSVKLDEEYENSEENSLRG